MLITVGDTSNYRPDASVTVTETNRTRDEAYKTLDLVHSAPVEAGRRASLLVDDPDQETSAVARWVVGRAAYERADYVAARNALGTALRRSRGLDDVEAQIRVSLAALDLEVGHTASAMRQLARAAEVVSERFAGRVLQQRSFILFQLGRARDAIDVADLALPLLGRNEDAIFQARLLINRGIAYLALDDLARAEVDFIACRALAVDVDQGFIVAAADHNLGFLAGRRGDIAGALHLYEQARDAYRELGDPGRVMPILEADMSETLLTAGLATDAAQSARRSLESSLGSGDVLQQAEARLRLARALLASDEPQLAYEHAVEAARLCRRARRRPLAALADFVAMQAQLALASASTRRGALLNRAERLVTLLDAEGWRHEARWLRIGIGRLAAELGQLDRARRHLSVAQTRGTSIIDRIHVSHALALSRSMDDDRAGAVRAARRGLAYLAEYRTTLGSTELRVSASAMATQMVDVGLRDALRRRDARSAIGWSEELRAASTRYSRPTLLDPVFELLLANHRVVAARMLDLAPTSADRGVLERAERAVIEHARRRRSDRREEPRPRTPWSVSEVSEALGDQVLVSFGQCDGELHAAVIGSGKARLQVIGGIPAVASEVAYLRAAARRMLSGFDRRNVIDGVRSAGDFADRMILGPLRLPADRPVVLVPSGPLFGMPWALLPSFHDRVLVVAPSVTSWRSLNAAPAWDGPTGVTIVVGPDIECGSAEAQLIVERHGGAEVLRAEAASVAAVKDAFASAGLVHLAAHGAFRADSPLLSSFRMADGPLTVFDIEHLARVPEVIILSSCEAASVSAFPGDDLMGVAATLVGRGVRSLIAPVDTVPDAALVEPMAELHHRLKAGAPTAEALAGARASFAPDSIERLTLATFQCIGANVVMPGVQRTTSG